MGGLAIPRDLDVASYLNASQHEFLLVNFFLSDLDAVEGILDYSIPVGSGG